MIRGKPKWASLLTVVFVTCMSSASAAPLQDKKALLSAQDPLLSGCVNETFGEVGNQTRWDLCYTVEAKHGLTIQRAFFRTSRDGRQIEILHDARVSELFVPYHDASRRFFDVLLTLPSSVIVW